MSFIIKIKNKCSIGTIPKLDCHVGKQKKNLKTDVEELSLHELESLTIRTKIGGEFSEVVKDKCSNHRYCFISDFSDNCRKCVDPLSIHKTIVKTSLHETRDNVLLDPRQRLFNHLNNLIFEKVNFGPKI